MGREHQASDSVAGVTIVELLIVVAIAAIVLAIGVPATAHLKDASRARHAAGFVSTRFRAARQQAIVQERNVAVVFDRQTTGWTFRICADGNGNGVRRAEMATGVDACPEGPYEFAALFPGAAIDVDPTLRGPDGESGSPDPVRFGLSDMASFAPGGSCTAGSVYVRSAHGLQYAVRVGGVTSRTRILKYDPGSKVWKDG